MYSRLCNVEFELHNLIGGVSSRFELKMIDIHLIQAKLNFVRSLTVIKMSMYHEHSSGAVFVVFTHGADDAKNTQGTHKSAWTQAL